MQETILSVLSDKKKSGEGKEEEELEMVVLPPCSDSISRWVEARDTHEDDGSKDGEAVVGSGEGDKL